MESIHQHWMRVAIKSAKKAWGQTHPNPLVGCVIVSKGQVVSEGFHARAGQLHAERSALLSLNADQALSEDTTLYVTMEPCSTHGRTPPCTDIILEKGIRHVVTGAVDPNPLHAGRGITLLRKHGVMVTTGILERDCIDLNLIFNHRMTKNGPMIAMKTATTLDGKTVSSHGRSKWITSEASRQHAMRWRQYFSAIAVGANTAIVDDPELTIREQQQVTGCPIRLLFDRSLKTVDEVDRIRLFNDAYCERTWLVTSSRNSPTKIDRFIKKGINLCLLDFEGNQFPLQSFLDWCDASKIHGLLLEGGSTLHSSFFDARGVDYLFHYQAPVLFASNRAISMLDCGGGFDPESAPRLRDVIIERLEPDQLTRGHLIYPVEETLLEGN